VRALAVRRTFFVPEPELQRLSVRRNSRARAIPISESTVVAVSALYSATSPPGDCRFLTRNHAHGLSPAGTFDALPSLRLRKR
jgi:hypothetical protein